jgi:hypothetical protein
MVNPTVTTSTSCGTSEQQVTIPVKDVIVSPSAPVICSRQSTTLTASYTGSSATYKWCVKGEASPLATTATLTQSPPITTTYQVVATTADCGTITKEVTVTVGTQTLSVSPSAATICAGGSTTLTATSTTPRLLCWSSTPRTIIITATTDAAGSALLALPTSLPGGVYIVRVSQ